MTKEETYVILNKNNLALEILLNDGYFTDQIPPCFTTKSLAKANSMDILEKVNSVSEKNDLDKKCFPIEITVYKDDILRRTLHFPNIVKYLKLLKKMSTRFDVYDSLLDSKHSESNAKILKKFDYPSNYQKSIIKRNSEFAGYKYKLKIDISHCYESIYSHSITWALVGKTIAKQMYLGQIKKSTLYNTGNDFDKFCSALKGNETNGIVVGPYSSRIISEIVLCGLDKELEEEKYKALPPEVRIKFLEALNRDEANFIKPLCICLMFSGLRIGEALAVTWGNVDFENKTLKVEQAITQEPKFDSNGKVKSRTTIIGTTKTTCSVREIPIADIVVQTLQD